jgi:hypothetical protein
MLLKGAVHLRLWLYEKHSTVDEYFHTAFDCKGVREPRPIAILKAYRPFRDLHFTTDQMQFILRDQADCKRTPGIRYGQSQPQFAREPIPRFANMDFVSLDHWGTRTERLQSDISEIDASFYCLVTGRK